MKRIISKVDLGRDGVLAAASSCKLDKTRYTLQEPAVVHEVGPSRSGLDPSKGDQADALLPVGKGRSTSEVRTWVREHVQDAAVDLLEVAASASAVVCAGRVFGTGCPSSRGPRYAWAGA